MPRRLTSTVYRHWLAIAISIIPILGHPSAITTFPATIFLITALSREEPCAMEKPVLVLALTKTIGNWLPSLAAWATVLMTAITCWPAYGTKVPPDLVLT